MVFCGPRGNCVRRTRAPRERGLYLDPSGSSDREPVVGQRLARGVQGRTRHGGAMPDWRCGAVVRIRGIFVVNDVYGRVAKRESLTRSCVPARLRRVLHRAVDFEPHLRACRTASRQACVACSLATICVARSSDSPSVPRAVRDCSRKPRCAETIEGKRFCGSRNWRRRRSPRVESNKCDETSALTEGSASTVVDWRNRMARFVAPGPAPFFIRRAGRRRRAWRRLARGVRDVDFSVHSVALHVFAAAGAGRRAAEISVSAYGFSGVRRRVEPSGGRLAAGRKSRLREARRAPRGRRSCRSRSNGVFTLSSETRVRCREPVRRAYNRRMSTTSA